MEFYNQGINIVYKKHIKEIAKIVFYANDLIFKVRCQNKEDKLLIIAIEHKLSNILNTTILKGVDCIVCWKVDIEVSNFGISGISILESAGRFKVKINNEKIIEVIELTPIIDLIKN